MQRGAAVRRGSLRAAWLDLAVVIGGPILVFSIWALADNERLFFVTLLNGLTLASLYFIVAAASRWCSA